MSADLGLATAAISASTFVYGLLADPPGADLRLLVRVLAVSLVLPAAVWLWAANRWPVGASAGNRVEADAPGPSGS